MDELEKIGRRMPYKVPEGYFDNMVSDIIAVKSHSANAFGQLRRIALAVASVAAVLFATYMAFDRNKITGSDVDDAFIAMSETDRSAFLELYQNDMYLFEN